MSHIANSTQSKRRPWPYDAIINGTPVMLQPGEDGNLVAQKSKTLDATAPTTFEYSSSNPAKERTFPWTKLFAGFGEGTEPDDRPRRYKYAVRADLSINGRWMKGPKFETHIETIHASAGEVRQLLLGPYNGSTVLFAICQNGVWMRASDGVWTAMLTAGTVPALPAGQEPQEAVWFRSRVSGVEGLYVGTKTGNLWEFNSSTLAFSQATTFAGPGTGAVAGEARYVERVGDELWVAGDYWIVKVEDSPMLRASYVGVIWIGDQASKITWLKAVGNTLYIFKTDGIYTVSDEGLDQELMPYLRGRRMTTNGRGAGIWMDKLWVPFGDQTYVLDADGNLTPDGLSQILENGSPVTGRAVGGDGHNTWFFYELYYDSVTGLTHLIKHGTWVEGNELAQLQEGQFSHVHHGSIAQWSKQGSAISVVSGIAASGNDRLYVGFTNGTVEWCVLPKQSPNPAMDAFCEFTGQDSYVYLPVHHMGFQADNKLYMGVSVPAIDLTSTEYAQVEYKLDLNALADWNLLSNDTFSTFTVPGQRIDFPTAGPVYSRQIEFRVKLIKDANLAASPANRTPVIEGLAVHQAVRPSLALEFSAQVRASSFLPKLNGTVDRRRGVAIHDEILATAAEPGVVFVTFSDGTQQEVTITDYKESWSSAQKRRDLDYLIQLEMIQYRTISHNRVFSGLTYATLEQYTVGQLESII